MGKEERDVGSSEGMAYKSPASDCPTLRKSFNTYNPSFKGTITILWVCGHRTEKSWILTPTSESYSHFN